MVKGMAPRVVERKVRFGLGSIHATPAAVRAMADAHFDVVGLLRRHASGDWGTVDAHDAGVNDAALASGARIISVYVLDEATDFRVWIITEAKDDDGRRASTCILLPDEY